MDTLQPDNWDKWGDEHLLAAMAHGCEEAMGPFYRRHNTLLYSLVSHMVNDREVANDLVQEAFVLIWRYAANYDPEEGSVRAWTATIARRHTIDYLRKQRRHSPFKELDLEAVDWDREIALPDVWEEVWDHEQRQRVHEALLQLRPEQRQVIILAYFHGMTHMEIAQYCELPLGTVKTRLNLAIRHLKKMLEPWHAEEKLLLALQ